MIERALITVSDKRGVVDLARELVGLKIELISTGGTYKEIQSQGIPVTPIESYTGFQEILDGRVKTLHPKIHGGILALRGKQGHMNELNHHGIKTIDLVVVNLYPFNEVIQKKDVSMDEAIENIDIGGVALLRASAKNFRHVTVISDPMDYPKVLSELKKGGDIREELRYILAVKAFEKTAHYDQLIFSYLSRKK